MLFLWISVKTHIMIYPGSIYENSWLFDSSNSTGYIVGNNI